MVTSHEILYFLFKYNVNSIIAPFPRILIVFDFLVKIVILPFCQKGINRDTNIGIHDLRLFNTEFAMRYSAILTRR